MSVVGLELMDELPYRSQIFYLVFVALAIFPLLLYVRQPLLHDEMTYLVIGREIASGGTLYAGIADHKAPGIYLLAAWLWSTVPEPYLSARILVYLANAVTAALLFKLGGHFRDNIGRVASLLFLLGVYSPVFDGYILMTEPFATMLVTGATLLLFEERKRTDIGAGLLLGFAVLFNQTVLLFGLVIVFWSVARIVSATDETGLYRVLSRYVPIGTGFIIPLGLTGLYAFSQGALSDMIFYTIYLPANYYDAPYFLQGQLRSAASFLPVWLLAIGTTLYIGRTVLSRRAFEHRLVYLCFWFGVLSIPGLISFHGGHRYIFIMPAAVLLAATGLSWIADFVDTSPSGLSHRQWMALVIVSVVSVAIFVGAAGFDSEYVLLVAFGLVGIFIGTAVVTYASVLSLGRRFRLTNQQLTALVAALFVVFTVVGGAAGVNGRYLLLLSDDDIETQAENAEQLGTQIDGRFYMLGPPTRYELAYFEDARPAQTFITAPYGEPLADRVIRTLEQDQVEYVLVERQQVTSGRIDPDHTYYAGPRKTVINYIEANYEPTATTDDFVIYSRTATGE